MKRVIKIFLTAVIAAVLVLSTSVSALAAGYPLGYEGLSSDDERAMYGILEGNIEELKTTHKIARYTDLDSYGAPTNVKVAFENDHPELFWLVYLSHDMEASSTRDHLVGFQVQSYTYDIGCVRDRDADEALMWEMVNQLCEEARAAGSTRYDQVLYIHDWLTTHNRYGDDAIAAQSAAMEQYGGDYKLNMDRVAWTCIAALDESLHPVCEGYSGAFKLLCDGLDIPCAYVNGTATTKSGEKGGHAWNYVMMEDGKWYAVDCTWDDQSYDGVYANWSGYENHDYFLKGSTDFFQNHKETAFSIDYPELSYSDYVPGSYTGEPVSYTPPVIDLSLADRTVAPTPTPSPTPYVVATPDPAADSTSGSKTSVTLEKDGFLAWYTGTIYGFYLTLIVFVLILIIIIAAVIKRKKKNRQK